MGRLLGAFTHPRKPRTSGSLIGSPVESEVGRFRGGDLRSTRTT